MGWHYKDIRTFPARFPIALREAVASLNSPILFETYATRDAALDDAERLSWFRWCIKQKPDVDKSLGEYVSLYQFRTKIDRSFGRFLLYLTAKPTRLSDLYALNPDLRDIITAECR